MSRKAFTLIEILVVVSILAILAIMIIPNFIGFDAEARVVTTKSNLETLRTRISLFRAKEGRYPASLGELITTIYYDAGIQRAYLNKLPAELISDKNGNSTYDDRPSNVAPSFLNNGGWVYFTDKAEMYVDWDIPLDKSWGEYAEQKPSEW
ncbi:MAG: prepilin-type N-terminal cleavage/methylation domain-containing protein [Candidatus Gygaella obscura]|nr:prepilin-type N-terminal cleavage/methylation domain-containing protein [Candidatus Gygaella obscura]